MSKRSTKVRVGIKPRVSRGLPAGARVLCADNSGAKEVQIISVIGYKGRLNRFPSAGVGDMVSVAVKEGTPEMRRQVLRAIVIRQRKPYRRRNGEWIQFEDNAVAIVSPEGDPKGSEIHGPMAREAAERWPRLAGIARIIV
ncbi:MAG: 50S ribosomal protein L14 [Candidatus Freyarchaeota archaeon]|nr:50S ribosomal protein L14 [Candidatus Jordarchaeia archaeon]